MFRPVLYLRDCRALGDELLDIGSVIVQTCALQRLPINREEFAEARSGWQPPRDVGAGSGDASDLGDHLPKLRRRDHRSITEHEIEFVILKRKSTRNLTSKLRSLIHSQGFCSRQLKALFVFINAQQLQFVEGARLQSQRMCATARGEVERAAFFRQLDVLVNEFRKSLAPIGGDVEVFEEGEFFR